MLEFGLIDGIIKEPLGGAHTDPEKMARSLASHIKKQIAELSEFTDDDLIRHRLDKYNKMGHFEEASPESS